MKISIKNKRVLLAAAIFCLSSAAWGTQFSSAASAQETQRGRTVTASPTPAVKISPAAAPGVSPTPASTPKSGQVQTLADLQAKIRAILSRPALMRGRVGIKVVSLDTNTVLFEDSAEKYFMPASNMKSFTVSTALSKLSPDFRFVTSVYAAAKPDADGTVKGGLTIYGRGDPSIAASFNNGDYYRGMQNLADKIQQAGVKKIDGDLVGDESYFTGGAIPPGWEWDDLQWYYGAEVSALTVDDNSLDVNVKPGSSVGSFANVTLAPAVTGVTVKNTVTTAPSGTKLQPEIFRPLAQNVFEVSGKIAVNDPGAVANFGSVAVTRPALVFVALLRQLLEQKGVLITGQTRVSTPMDRAAMSVSSSTPWIEIAKLESPPLSVVAAKTLKPSQNLYTELILRALGENLADKNSNKTSDQKGIAIVDKFLREAGVADGSVMMYDASGLSRHDLVTPASLVQIYTYMSKGPYAQIWRDALPVGGVDGTLKTRLKGAATANNVHAKTGTIDQVSALSGYLNSASGERLVFSIMTNEIMSQNLRQSTIDEIVTLLANYNGKSN
jgi:D-alanyl-D-alanine carboxypeptidase/D-alanyl-D-alanine-endopeptidase (penicillin-binding protein 4)